MPDGGEVAEAVIDGEVVDAPPPRALIPAPVLRSAARPLAAHAGYVAAGAVVAARRWHRRRTVHARMIRAAEASGDHATALAWAQQREAERKGRSDRRRDLAHAVTDVARAAPVLAVIAAALMIAAGGAVAWQEKRLAGLAWPWEEAARLVTLAIEVASAAWTAATVLLPLGVLACLHHLGRHAGDLAPSWAVAARAEEEDRGLVVTADAIVLGLRHTPIAPLARALKDGWRPVFSLPPVREGRGYEYEHSLPLGVTAEMIADQRAVLARNLHRDVSEVWPSAGAPGYARVYVIDRGALERAAPEYPLMHEGQADVFEGVPGGVLARGDGALIPVTGNNGDFGGMMGQGKSNAGRVVMLGCCTDPLCRVDVFVFANNGDFDAYQPRLACYHKGTEDDTVAAAVRRLEELYEDVGRREARLAELGAKKLTRQLAAQHPDMRPVVALFSECHELFGHPEHGALAAELATKTIKRARKTGISLWFDTQSSRKEAIPPKLVELVSVNCCFAVKTWRSNDGFLGDGSFAAGIRATELRPGRDRGTSLVTGISDAQFELLKWYFIPVDDDTGYDAAAEVIARCMRSVAPGTPVGAQLALPMIEARDLLADLWEVTRDDAEPARLADLPARLRSLAPRWGAYRSLNGVQLAALLDAEEVRWTNAKNVPRLDPADLRAALARRGGEVS